MRWFARKDRVPPSGESTAADRLRCCQDNRRAIADALGTVLDSLRGGFPEQPVPGQEACLAAIETVRNALAAEKQDPDLLTLFDENLPVVCTHFQQQKAFWEEKVDDYKEIVAILTKAMADISVDNRQFSEKIFEKSESVAKIADLEDVKSIKSALKREAAAIRSAVQEKQAQDAQMIDLLSEQVSTLKSELESSQQAYLRDGLTGLYNEQALNRYLKTLVRAGARPSFSMLVFDIDHFEKIEATYGAGLGQRVILAAGRECLNLFHRQEFVARYKKGTFVVVLPAVPLKAAVQKARTLCRSIAAKRYQIDEQLAGHTLSFTVSVGVSTFKKQDSAAAVTGRAVQALYAARRAGTNRVVSEKAMFLRFKKEGAETLEDI